MRALNGPGNCSGSMMYLGGAITLSYGLVTRGETICPAFPPRYKGEPARDELTGEELYYMTESGPPQYSQPFDIKIGRTGPDE